MSQQRIALLWQRYGPYHAARLRGLIDAAKTRGWEAFGIEVASRDEYAWSSLGGAESLRTLFPSSEYRDISKRQLSMQLEKVLQREGTTAVCVNGWSVPEAVAARKWGLRQRIPVILMSETHQPSKMWIKEWVKGWRVRPCHGALVGGRWQRDYMVRLGMEASRIRLGYDAVDNSHFASLVSDAAAEKAGIPNAPYFFVNTRFLHRKGVSHLLHAYQRYVQSWKDSARPCWKLVISGSGEEEIAWKRLAIELGLEGMVIWLGFVQYDSLPAWYQRAGAFVHPATAEAWGLVINEACAAGLPIIAGIEVGATCELVEPGVNGWLVEPTNIDSLARVLREAATMDAGALKQLGQASRDRVANWGPERFGESVCELLSLPRKAGDS